MMNFGWEENSWKQKGQSTLFSPTCTARYEPLKRETMFPPVSKVNLRHFVGHELPIECPTTLYELQQRPLDLQLSADEFIYHVEKRSRIENGWNFAEAPTSFFLSGVSSSNSEDPKLSLSIGKNNTMNFLAKQTCFSNHKLIDSEEGTEINFLRKKSYSSSQEHSECCLEPGYSSEGFRDCGDGIPCDDLQSKVQLFVSSQSEGVFDLNKALQDDSSCSSEDHNDLNGSQQDKTVKAALPDLNRNYTDEDIWTPNSEDNSACGSVVTLASPNKQKLSCESPCPNSTQKGNRSNSGYDSSSGKTQHSVTTSDVSDQCLRSQVAENNSGEKPSESDFPAQEAAGLLIHMSFVHSACDQDSNTKLESTEKPEHSYDSFELNTLNLTETNLDDDSASSKPVFTNDADGKDFGAKLRRGRRMKDFQKEILPSLASLSRHEILEDINIMEGALRSREYRKNRGKRYTTGLPHREVEGQGLAMVEADIVLEH